MKSAGLSKVRTYPLSQRPSLVRLGDPVAPPVRPSPPTAPIWTPWHHVSSPPGDRVARSSIRLYSTLVTVNMWSRSALAASIVSSEPRTTTKPA